VHLFFFNNRIKSEETNHQQFLWKNDDYAKTEKENKNRRHGFRRKPSDNKVAKFQPNGFRGYRLGVKNVRLNFRNFRSEKKRKIYFLRHLTCNRIIMPKGPCWCLPERYPLVITIGVWQVICSRPNLYAGPGGNTLYLPVKYKLQLSEVS